jgi:hypothetical protein
MLKLDAEARSLGRKHRCGQQRNWVNWGSGPARKGPLLTSNGSIFGEEQSCSPERSLIVEGKGHSSLKVDPHSSKYII